MNQSAHNLQMSCNEQFDIAVSVMGATMTRAVNPSFSHFKSFIMKIKLRFLSEYDRVVKTISPD